MVGVRATWSTDLCPLAYIRGFAFIIPSTSNEIVSSVSPSGLRELSKMAIIATFTDWMMAEWISKRFLRCWIFPIESYSFHVRFFKQVPLSAQNFLDLPLRTSTQRSEWLGSWDKWKESPISSHCFGPLLLTSRSAVQWKWKVEVRRSTVLQEA